jgi:hypothetical protein
MYDGWLMHTMQETLIVCLEERLDSYGHTSRGTQNIPWGSSQNRFIAMKVENKL